MVVRAARHGRTRMQRLKWRGEPRRTCWTGLKNLTVCHADLPAVQAARQAYAIGNVLHKRFHIVLHRCVHIQPGQARWRSVMLKFLRSAADFLCQMGCSPGRHRYHRGVRRSPRPFADL